ncbi:MAG TPA: alpha-amylase family glycosyl hydrolase [Flavobacterium sp.]|nr:alpha-amylase family glycosyl hydrolase [Flavobacterium sp.]
MKKIPFLLVLALFFCVQNKAQNANASKWPRGITYEIFVASFADSNGDGIGDINGMTAKLDYLAALGVEGIWLMPMNPSPSYHKYDVTDYYGIHPDYGTLEDFKKFIAEAHKRNIKVIMDMVINHSSSKHPWFIDAAKNSDSPYRDYYVWTHKDDPQTKTEGKVTGGDSSNRNHWNKVEGSDYMYYSYFGRNMPDLNYDSPKLREEMFKVGKFWLTDIGVDGFRLDAARHIFPEERAPDNHKWWVYFRNEMQKANKDVYLVGEVWAPANVVGPYMKGLPALFNFDMGYAITKAVNTHKTDSLVLNHKKIRDFYHGINADYVDATFLTNHDQERIMSAVSNDPNKAKMAAALLLTLPGSPYLYYGEELGMPGEKPDQNIREPLIWDVKAKDKSRTKWMEPKFTTDATVIPAAAQVKDKNSIYNFYKMFINLRNHSKALTYGELEPLAFGNPAVCGFLRTATDDTVLVLHNLSDAPISLALPTAQAGYGKVYFTNNKAGVKNGTAILPAYSTLVLKK